MCCRVMGQGYRARMSVCPGGGSVQPREQPQLSLGAAGFWFGCSLSSASSFRGMNVCPGVGWLISSPQYLDGKLSLSVSA